MSLNTPTELRAYVRYPASTVISDADLQVYLDTANLVVTEDMATCTMTDARKKLIELNLAAHFSTKAIYNGGLVMQKVGESEERYQAMSDKQFGLGSSHYGQIAMNLDPCGILTKMATNPLKAQFQVV